MSTWDWNDDDEPVKPKKRKDKTPPSGESMKPKIDYKLDLHAPVMEAQGNATIPVAWCFKPDSPLRALFEAEQWQNPHIVLIVSSFVSSTEDGRGRTKEKWQDTAVYAAKVTEALKYLSFRRPGRNRVRAVLVDVVSKKEKARLADLIHVKRFGTDYSFSDPDLAEYESIGLGDFDRKIYDESAEFFVDVPEAMFAAPPKGFKKAVIQFWWGDKALEDACDSRKKAWVIGTPAWFVTLPFAYTVKALMVAIMVVLGNRGLKEGVFWKTLVNPMKGIFATMDAPYDGSSIYIRPKNSPAGYTQEPYFERDDKKALLGFMIFLNPAIWFGPATIAYVISRIKYHHVVGNGETKHEVYTRVADWTYLEAVWKVDRFILLILAFLAVVGLIAAGLVTLLERRTVRGLWHRFAHGLGEWFGKPVMSEQESEKQRRQMLDQLALLACGPEGAPLTVGQLPKDLRTLSLRYNELKTKVCKPFAS